MKSSAGKTNGESFLGAKDEEWKVSIFSIIQELNTELTANIFDAIFEVFCKKDPYQHIEITDHMCKEIKNHKGKRNSLLANHIKLENGSVYSELYEYAPKAFDYIREISGITQKQMIDATDPVKNLTSFIDANESQGKSGSFFMFSHDKSLVLKTIKEKEVKLLIKLLKFYAEHLRTYPNSLLCRIYGLFHLKLPGISAVYLMVMDNLLKNCSPSLLFDLKGSTLGRCTKRMELGISVEGKRVSAPLKDLDFLEFKIKIPLHGEIYEEKQNSLITDVEFLRKYRLMDYSLLLSVEKVSGNPVFTFGIIDFLTRYGFFKRMERAFTILRNPKHSSEASVINPVKYADRFLSFMFGKVFTRKEHKQNERNSDN